MLHVTNITKDKNCFILETAEEKTYSLKFDDNNVNLISYTGRSVKRLPALTSDVSETGISRKYNTIIDIIKDAISANEYGVTKALQSLATFYNNLDIVDLWDLRHGLLPIECPKGLVAWARENNKRICSCSIQLFEIDQVMKNMARDERFFCEKLKEYNSCLCLDYLNRSLEERKIIFAITKGSFKNYCCNVAGELIEFFRLYDIQYLESLDTNRDLAYNTKLMKTLREKFRAVNILNNEKLIKDIETLSNEIYTIKVPSCLEDFTDEGKQQHNCVGYYYHDHIAKGDDLIYFIRKTEAPDKSYMTCRFHRKAGETVEHRIVNNQWSDEANDFIRQIDDLIRKLLGD